MSTYRTLAVVLIMLSAAVAGGTAAVAAQEGPGEPANFYGDAVDEDGNDAPTGTTIVAVVDGEVEGEITVETTGEYGEEDAFGDKLSLNSGAGDTVSFHVDDPAGPEADESPRDLESGTHELDLTFPAGTFADDDDDDDDDDTTTGGTGPAADDDDDVDDEDDVVDDEDDVVDDEDDVVDDVEDDIIDDVIDDEVVPDAEDVPEEAPTVEEARQDLDATEPNTQSTTPIEDNDPDRPGVTVAPEETESVSEITFSADDAAGNVDVSEWQDPPESVSQSVSGSVTAAVEAEAEENIEAAASVPVVSDIDPDTDEVRGDSATVQKTVDADRLDDPSDAVIAQPRRTSRQRPVSRSSRISTRTPTRSAVTRRPSKRPSMQIDSMIHQTRSSPTNGATAGHCSRQMSLKLTTTR